MIGRVTNGCYEVEVDRGQARHDAPSVNQGQGRIKRG